MSIAEIIKTVSGLPAPVINLSCDFLRALGYPANELWGSIGDGIKARRIGRALRIIKRTRYLAEEQGIAVEKGAVHEAFFFPFLDGAQDAGDESLEEWWARLLTSAIESPMNQHPAFAHCLRQLVRDETVLLKYMRDAGGFISFNAHAGDFYAKGQVEGGIRCFLEPPDIHYPRLVRAYTRHLVSLGLLVEYPTKINGHSVSAFGASFLDACGVRRDPSRRPRRLRRKSPLDEAVASTQAP